MTNDNDSHFNNNIMPRKRFRFALILFLHMAHWTYLYMDRSLFGKTDSNRAETFNAVISLLNVKKTKKQDGSNDAQPTAAPVVASLGGEPTASPVAAPVAATFLEKAAFYSILCYINSEYNKKKTMIAIWNTLIADDSLHRKFIKSFLEYGKNDIQEFIKCRNIEV